MIDQDDDLTPLRSRLFKLCKEKYKTVTTINGKIVINRDSSKMYVESPEDLFTCTCALVKR